MGEITVPALYYRQFDADFSLEVPAEGFGGWDKANLPLNTEHTAFIVMHACYCGTREQYPGWHRAVEYIPRSYAICRDMFPKLLDTVRKSGMRVLHVPMGEKYYDSYAGYKITEEYCGADTGPSECIEADSTLLKLQKFRIENVFPGFHNMYDLKEGYKNIRFIAEAEPKADEPVVRNSRQLFTLCGKFGINHLIYIGFALDSCILMSPGGMIDMSRRGIMCSAIRQAVTAVENRETARTGAAKEIALWRVATSFGFVYDADDFINAIEVKQKTDR